MITLHHTNDHATIKPSDKKSGIKEIPVIFGSHGTELHGKIMLPASASAASPVPGAVLSHGFASDGTVMESSARLLVKKGISAMIFDLRGHGDSGGSLDGNCQEDIIDACNVLSSLPEVDSSRIALIGHSLGAIESIIAATRIKNLKALVALACPPEVDNPMLKDPAHKPLQFIIRKMIEVVFKYFVLIKKQKVKVDWKNFLESWPRIRLSAALAELDNCAKLFVFSEKDPLSTFEKFMPAWEKTAGPKQKMLAGGSHMTPVEAEILRFEWIGWAVAVLKA